MSDQTMLAEQQLVVFTLSGELYGVNIALVQEIIRMQHITKVPRAPEHVEGVTNLRGRVIPVVNLRHSFSLPMGGLLASERIVVVEIGDQTIEMIVDGVSGVLRVTADSIEPPSSVLTTVDLDFLRGIIKVDERLIMLLSLDKILDHKAFAIVSEAPANLTADAA